MRVRKGILWLFFFILLTACLYRVPAFGATLEEGNRLNAQVVQLYRQGRYSEAIVYAKKALVIFKKILGEKHPKTATRYNNLGLLYLSLGDYSKAEPLFQKVLSLYKEALGEKHPATAVSYNNLGELYRRMGDFDRAEPMYKKALSIKEKAHGKKHPDTATSYNNLGLLYVDMGDYNKAEPVLQKALKIHKDVLGEKHPSTAMSYSNLGEFYRHTGDYRKAESLSQKALKTRKQVLGEKHPDTAKSYNNVGELYRHMGDYSKAEPLLKKALAIAKNVLGERYENTAGNYSNLGLLYHSTFDYAKAEPLFKKALEIHKELLGVKHPSTATSYNNLGAHYLSIGDYGKAEPLLQKALKIRKKVLGEKHPDTATSYNNLGRVYHSTGDYPKTMPLYQKALAICKQVLGERHPRTALGANNLAKIYEEMGVYRKAEPLYQKALAIRKKVFGENHIDTVASYCDLGGLHLLKGEVPQAIAIFTEQDVASGLGHCYLVKKEWSKARNAFSRSLNWTKNVGKQEWIIGDYVGLGFALEGLGDYGGAKVQFERAISMIESQRGTLSGSVRESFMEGKVGSGFSRIDAYEGMIRVIWKGKNEGYEAKAFQYCERVKSRVFLEMLASRGIIVRNAADQKTMAQDREFQRQLISLRKLVKTLGELGVKAPKGRLDAAGDELERTEAAYETFIKDVKLQNTELASLITVDVPSPSKVQTYLDQDTTLLEYFIGKGNTYAWLMTRDRIRMYEIPIGEKKASNMVNNLLLPNISNRTRRPEPMIILAPRDSEKTTAHDRKKNREMFLDGTKGIYQSLIAPLAGDIKTGRLIVAPHGTLHKIPFGTLNDGHASLVDRYAITMVPSASIIPQVASRRKAEIGSLLAMGNPQTEYVPLGFAENEVDWISRFFPAKNVYKRGKATEKRLKDEARGPGVIHLACHGEFQDRQPLQSGLLLAAGEGDDGRLQVHEIFGMDLRNASLVTLSACETALGTISTGDDMVGLSRAFIYAGTPSLIASLWEVDDESTGILMTRFYENWKNKGMNKSEALRQAQISLKAMPRYRHPYHWAAFVLIGDWM